MGIQFYPYLVKAVNYYWNNIITDTTLIYSNHNILSQQLWIMNNLILELLKIDLELHPFCFVLTTPRFFFFFFLSSLSIFVLLLFNVKLHVPIVFLFSSCNSNSFWLFALYDHTFFFFFFWMNYMTTLGNNSTIRVSLDSGQCAFSAFVF